jgi:hypothetical protein
MKNSNSRSLQYDLGENRLERAARIAEIERIQAKEYTPQDISKKEAEEMFSKYKPVKKSFTTDFLEPSDPDKKPRTVSKFGNTVRSIDLNVLFPKGTVGNLRGFFSYSKPNIVSDIREIFENAQYGYSTNYTETGHKEQSNIEAYHHFINKVIVNGEPYYIRFTVQELTGKGQIHSAQITSVEIIKEKSREDRSLPEPDPGGTVQSAFDESLVDFFNSVKVFRS